QDGSYLAEFLLGRGYDVHGLVPLSGGTNVVDNVIIHHSDLSDASNLGRILDQVRPDEVYNLGAQSHVRLSFDLPVHTALVTGVGTLRVLETIREHQDATGRQ